MASERRVIVVGSVNVDMVATADRLPAPGETLTGSTFAAFDGGKGANQAVAAVRLGASTAFVGAIGRDAFGLRARAALEREGIDLRGLRTIEGASGVALILVDAHGENLISVASGANAMFAPADVTAAFEVLAPGPADVVLVGHEIPTLAAKHALRSARSAGSTTVFNPAPATGVDRSVFGFADILTANELEIAAILATDGEADAGAEALLLDRDGAPGVARAVVVTHGAAGAEVVTPGGKPARVPAPDVPAIDAVGAGDTFAGALAAGVLANLDLTLAVRRAVAAASLSTTRPGARGGMPTTAELETFLHSA
jgi:ribokinase